MVRAAVVAAACAAVFREQVGVAGLAAKRIPWDLGRFAKQALYFNDPLGNLLRGRQNAERGPLGAGAVLWPRAGVDWGPLDDVVMGGASSSDWKRESDRAVWSGDVTTANNGGFAGARTRAFSPPVDASAATGLFLRGLRNLDDNTDPRTKRRTYKFIVRDNADFNGVAWTWEFDAFSDRTTDVMLAFRDAIPTRFANILPGLQPLDTRTLTTLQVAYSKFAFDDDLNNTFREGPFALALSEIALY